MSIRREEPVLSNTRYVKTLPISSVAVQAPVAASRRLIVLPYDADATVFESWDVSTTEKCWRLATICSLY
jgi:hypothetical protein